MTAAVLLATAAILVASLIQSATGFGFALVAGPALFAITTPSAAVGLILVVGQVVNLLVLFFESRRPVIDWSAVRTATAAAVPGMPIGALIVRLVDVAVLRVGVGVVVCAAVLFRLAQRQRERRGAGRSVTTAVVAGFAVGVLTTSTTTSGPPLAIWLTARGLSPTGIRDTVTALFFALDVFGLAIFVPVVGVHAAALHAGWLAVLVPTAIVGHLGGRQVFLRLPGHHYERVVLAIALLAGATSAVTGLV